MTCRRPAPRLLLVAFLALMAAAVPGVARAQSILARAVVIGTNLAMTRERDLDFGDVVRNTVVTIPVDSNGSARWRITGTQGAQVALTFFLPPALTVGANSLPISFNNTAGGESIQNNPRFAILFDPKVVHNTNLRVNGGGLLVVWLGGTVTVSPVQPPGVYTGNATLVVTYTGS
jgi:hypothetical protein